MIKKLKNIFSILIGAIILIELFIPIFSYASSPKYTNYLAMGDSIAFGYGLTDRNSR